MSSHLWLSENKFLGIACLEGFDGGLDGCVHLLLGGGEGGDYLRVCRVEIGQKHLPRLQTENMRQIGQVVHR